MIKEFKISKILKFKCYILNVKASFTKPEYKMLPEWIADAFEIGCCPNERERLQNVKHLNYYCPN